MEDLIALYYEETHPDRERTFLGIFSTPEKAKTVMNAHMALEQERLPGAHVSEACYVLCYADLDLGTS